MPDGWSGAGNRKPSSLRIVEGCQTAPCDFQVFPLWLAGVISMVVVVVGAVGLRLWIVPVIQIEPGFDVPTIEINSSVRGQKEKQNPHSAAQFPVRGLPPVAPRVKLSKLVPAVQLQLMRVPFRFSCR